MKNKYSLNEQQSIPGTNVPGSENIQNKLLKLAVNNGCFTDKGFVSGAFKDLKTGKEVMYKKSDNKKLVDEKRNYIFIVPEDNGIFFTVEYRDRPDEQGKVVKSKSGIRCKTIKQTTDPELTPDQSEIIKFLKQNGFQNYAEVTPDRWANKSLVDIYKDSDVIELMKDKPYLLQQIQSNKDRVFWMWKGSTSVSGLKSDFEDKSKEGQKFVDFLIKNGWKKRTDIVPENAVDYQAYDLSKIEDYDKNAFLNKYKDYQKYFQGSYVMYQPIEKKTLADATQEIKNVEESIKVNFDKKNCRNVIAFFVTEYFAGKSFPTTPKNLVEGCLSNNGGSYPNLYPKVDILKLQLPDGHPFNISRKINYKIKAVKESEDNSLKNIISESLNRAKLQKKSLIKESKIVRNRLEVLVENRDLSRKRDLERFFGDYLTETAYLNSKGYNTEIINEQFFDILKGFFTGTGLDSILGTFKEYAAKWIIQKFGVDPSGWIGSIITTAVGNLPLGDIPKLTDCDYVVPYLAKTIGESAVKKFMAEKGVDNPLTSVIRNAVVEVLEDTAFGQSIEKGLEKIICPLLGDLSKKMGKVTNNLKNKALEDKGVTSPSTPSIPGGGLMQAV